MAIALLFAAGDDCVRQTDLSCPAKTIAASIIIYDCSASDGSHYDLWQFSGKAGDTIAIDMHATAFDSYLVLLDPNDVPAAENDDAARGNNDARIVYTLTSTGTWTVVANTLREGSAGDYALSISCPANVRRRAAKH
ncbi:MAG TPA: PPC domain-containing protein [Thermoanaerobaculia bacterium]